jgi:hypothetical protein
MIPEATLERVFCSDRARASEAAPTTAKIDACGTPRKPKAVMIAKTRIR